MLTALPPQSAARSHGAIWRSPPKQLPHRCKLETPIAVYFQGRRFGAPEMQLGSIIDGL